MSVFLDAARNEIETAAVEENQIKGLRDELNVETNIDINNGRKTY